MIRRTPPPGRSRAAAGRPASSASGRPPSLRALASTLRGAGSPRISRVAPFPPVPPLLPLLLAALLCACAAGPVAAGPNSGAKLIVHANPNLTFTTDVNWDGYSELYNCEDAITQVPGDGQGVIFFVMLAFDDFASPRVKAMSFGIECSSPLVEPVAWKACGWDPFVVEGIGWPRSGTGVAVTWTDPLTRQINEVFWLASYAYTGNTIKVTSHPLNTIGDHIVDDSFPPEPDYVGGPYARYYDANYYGMIGFGREGNNPCAAFETPGACCSRSGQCILQTRGGCAGFAGYVYHGDGTLCSPNPCTPGMGACCIRGECFLLDWGECLDSRGSFSGEGVGCQPNPCGFGEIDASWSKVKNRYRP